MSSSTATSAGFSARAVPSIRFDDLPHDLPISRTDIRLCARLLKRQRKCAGGPAGSGLANGPAGHLPPKRPLPMMFAGHGKRLRYSEAVPLTARLSLTRKSLKMARGRPRCACATRPCASGLAVSRGSGPAPGGRRVCRPIPVEVRQPDPGALQVLAALIEPLIHPLTTTGIVVIFVIFILLQQNDLRNRLVRLAGAKDLHRTTAALDDAGND
jgi:hypothetical protein